jgi:hypothetical protein
LIPLLPVRSGRTRARDWHWRRWRPEVGNPARQKPRPREIERAKRFAIAAVDVAGEREALGGTDPVEVQHRRAMACDHHGGELVLERASAAKPSARPPPLDLEAVRHEI